MGGHIPELVIVLVVALLIFGPKKLPEMGSAIGKSIKEFRKGMNEISNSPKTNENASPKETTYEPRLPLNSQEKVETPSSYASEEVGAEASQG
jgi:sec-independent protein translocase protein TatA